MAEDSNPQDKKIQELQMSEHQMQQILVEKQTIQVELNEVENAIGELKKTDDEVYRVLGNIMLKSSKNDLMKELEERKKLLEMRISSVEKHEKNQEEKMEKLRDELNSIVTKKR